MSHLFLLALLALPMGSSSGRYYHGQHNFTTNTAFEDGGGISNEGVTATLVVLNSTFSGNVAFDFPNLPQEEEGGALVNIDGIVTIANSTFFGNSVPSMGGAIFNSGNNAGAGNLTLINSTINNNTSGGGGAIFTEKGGVVTLRNTLFAGNPGNNCGSQTSGVIVDEGGNLDDGTSCPFTSSLSSGGAGLDPLGVQNNGGPTDTVALTTASGAVDLGLNAVCAVAPVSNLDQRGGTRPSEPPVTLGPLSSVQPHRRHLGHHHPQCQLHRRLRLHQQDQFQIRMTSQHRYVPAKGQPSSCRVMASLGVVRTTQWFITADCVGLHAWTSWSVPRGSTPSMVPEETIGSAASVGTIP